MILVDAKCTILPERQGDFTGEVRKILTKVRAEAGCHRYELFADAHRTGVFHFIEEWESQEHLDKHLTQPHMQEYFAKTASWRAAPIELTLYEIRSSRSTNLE